VYEKIDKELLQHVEDVLLNRREDSTERLLEYAGTLDPKSKPTAVRKLNEEPPAPVYTPKQNPIPADFDPLAPDADLPPVPTYKPWKDPLATSEAFGQLESLMKARIIFIDGAMGTMIQRYKLEEEDFRGDRCADAAQGQQQQQWPATAAAAAVGPAEVFWGILPATVRVWAAASAVEK
jgi:5-methyltetrahydrofolate--homocysteine methyltransferase